MVDFPLWCVALCLLPHLSIFSKTFETLQMIRRTLLSRQSDMSAVLAELKAMHTKVEAMNIKVEAMNTRVDAKINAIAGTMDARWDSHARLYRGSIAASLLVLAYAVSQSYEVVRIGALTERNSSVIDGLMSNKGIKRIRGPSVQGPTV